MQSPSDHRKQIPRRTGVMQKDILELIVLPELRAITKSLTRPPDFRIGRFATCLTKWLYAIDPEGPRRWASCFHKQSCHSSELAVWHWSTRLPVMLIPVCWQLPEGIRTNRVVAEVPQFPLMNIRGKRWAKCGSRWQLCMSLTAIPRITGRARPSRWSPCSSRWLSWTRRPGDCACHPSIGGLMLAGRGTRS